MDMIKNMFVVFIYSIAASTICSTIYMTIFEDQSAMQVEFLWSVILVSVFCSFVVLFFYSKNEQKHIVGRPQFAEFSRCFTPF